MGPAIRPKIAAWVTGKFVLHVVEGLESAPRLAVAVELADGVEATAQREEAISASVLDALLRLNSEFANYVPAEHRQPEVSLKRAGDPEWFPIGVKHRYTRRL